MYHRFCRRKAAQGPASSVLAGLSLKVWSPTFATIFQVLVTYVLKREYILGSLGEDWTKTPKIHILFSGLSGKIFRIFLFCHLCACRPAGGSRGRGDCCTAAAQLTTHCHRRQLPHPGCEVGPLHPLSVPLTIPWLHYCPPRCLTV